MSGFTESAFYFVSLLLQFTKNCNL